MINDQVKQSLYNLTLFEAIAEEANQDPFQYERYTFLLQNFLKNIEEAYTSHLLLNPLLLIYQEAVFRKTLKKSLMAVY